MASSRLCSIPDCNKPHNTRGLCAAHAWRLRKYGDPLHGGPLKFYGKPAIYYETVVRQYEGDECLPWPFSRSSFGYGVVRIDGKRHSVHRRLCEDTYGPPPSPVHEAAHSCGNGRTACCTKRHLRWATGAENAADKILHGTAGRGETHHSFKLTESDVRQIRRLKDTVSMRQLAKQFAVSRWTIQNVVHRQNWRWLD